ncbi:unnamed protein product [Adineta steineri]|uniref:NAD(P)(+)--arginine ADP-ribosyltransferase n=1 Tax=Adineta steineri TaxID=433720 RepID=A0A818IUJ4_9BILA|nr:unnamed protein product [Adineta steineri]
MRTSESESNQNAAAPSKSTTSSNIRQLRLRRAQNYLLLWVDTSIDQKNEDYENTLKQIRTITDDVSVFTHRDECIDFLTDAQEDVKSFLVVKDTMFQQIMPLINDIPQLDGVYILNDIETLHEEWIKKCKKVRRIHTNINEICKGLQSDIKQYNQDSITMSFITTNEMASTQNLNQLEPNFMYTQIFKEILLDMQHDEQAMKRFIAYCRHHDYGSAKNIDEFEKKYEPQSTIWWYTCPSFIYSMLNCALRSMEGDTIINMGFFIHDLHQQIQQLYQEQVNSYHDRPFLVYRGQGLMKSDFEKLQKTKDGLISFNNFLSTSKDKEVSLNFALCALTNPDTVGILFVMSIDPCIKSTPFASIKEMSYFNEEDETLFSMHTVFRVGVMKQMDNENQLYQVELQLTSDDDQQLRVLTDGIREEAGGGTGWQRLGDLLLKIGQFNKAEELYNALLEQTSNESEKGFYYGCLGFIKNDQGDYEKAIWYDLQGLEIYQKTLPSNHSHLATSYSNIGLVHFNMGECSEALSYYEKGLEIRQKTLPSNHPYLATSYSNIGSVYAQLGEYSKALSSHEKAVEIFEKTLPSNHPYLATSYSKISDVYARLGEYSKALSFHEKALEIYQKSLPSNHPHLAASYSNIGLVYDNMGEYSKALSSHEKALHIRAETLPSNHPDLATSYYNIGSVYDKMEEYPKALSFYEKDLEICENSLPSNHPDLATPYYNIGSVYNNMGEYSKALSSHEKALHIRAETLPSNHPDLATSYYNIGKYPKALTFYDKEFEIIQQSVPSNHRDLATSYSSIGRMHCHMEEYSKALSFFEKDLEICENSLPSNHPDLATSYYNIGSVYNNMGEYSKALSFHEKAIDIREKTLSSNHLDLATSYSNIGSVYDNMAEYSKALSFFEKAIDIREKTLSSNHPSLATSYNKIGLIDKPILIADEDTSPHSYDNHLSNSILSMTIAKSLVTKFIKDPLKFSAGKENVITWIDEIEQQFNMMHLSNADKLNLIHICLNGDALQWFKQHKHKFTSWTIFINEIKKSFTSNLQRDLAFEKLKQFIYQ